MWGERDKPMIEPEGLVRACEYVGRLSAEISDGGGSWSVEGIS